MPGPDHMLTSRARLPEAGGHPAVGTTYAKGARYVELTRCVLPSNNPSKFDDRVARQILANPLEQIVIDVTMRKSDGVLLGMKRRLYNRRLSGKLPKFYPLWNDFIVTDVDRALDLRPRKRSAL